MTHTTTFSHNSNANRNYELTFRQCQSKGAQAPKVRETIFEITSQIKIIGKLKVIQT
jgi:hypothetical protein